MKEVAFCGAILWNVSLRGDKVVIAAIYEKKKMNEGMAR